MFKEKDLVELYQDWQNNRSLLGVAILERFLKEDLPFVPEFDENGFKNEIFTNAMGLYIGQRWKVSFLTLTPVGKEVAQSKYLPYYWIRKRTKKKNN